MKRLLTEDPSILKQTNNLSAILAVVIFSLCIFIFIARLLQRPALGLQIGIVLQLAILPLLYLLWTAPQVPRLPLYYVQAGLMLIFLIVELFLDYILKTNFRNIQSYVVPYVMLFFAGTGGMIGIAANAGRKWSITAVVLFLVMTVLAFVQRVVTGL
jgi:hypothetical protein